MSRQFISSHICLILACTLLLDSSAATSPSRRSSRSALSSLSPKSERFSVLGPCRCVPDQWEAVMRSVERDVDLQAAVMSLFPPSQSEDMADLRDASSSPSSEEVHVGDDVDINEMIGLVRPEEPQRNAPDLVTPRSTGEFTASDDSTTAIYYDYAARRLALIEHHQVGGGSSRHTRTINDHKAGVRYVISSDGACRTSDIRPTMKRMCLPAGVTLSGKFTLGTDLQVSLWTATGPNNSTLRTAVDRRRCIPVYEETFTLEPDYMSLKTTFYTNARLGIKDNSVFAIPSACHSDGMETGTTSDTKRRP